MTHRINLIRSLDRDQVRIVAGSLLLLPTVRVSLILRGFMDTATVLAKWSERRALPSRPADAAPAAQAVRLVAGRPVVGARCLTRSLVLWFFLRRRGIDAELVLGAARSVDGKLPAHAWVELDGVAVNDATDIRDRFTSFDVKLPRLTAAE